MVTRGSGGASPVTVAEFAFWKVEKARRTVVALGPAVVRFAKALSIGVTLVLARPFRIAFALDAVRIAVVALGASVAERSTVSGLTKTLSAFWFADVSGGALTVADAKFALRIVVVSNIALFALQSTVVGLALALASLRVAVVVDRIAQVTVAESTIWKSIVVFAAFLAVRAGIAYAKRVVVRRANNQPDPYLGGKDTRQWSARICRQSFRWESSDTLHIPDSRSSHSWGEKQS